MTSTTIKLTPDTIETFTLYAEDAGNWSGNPWVSVGNITCTREMRGNLSDLVQKGLIRIEDAGDGDKYIVFTDSGLELARVLGIEIY